MKKALAVLATVATVGATTMSSPAEAYWRGGWGWRGVGPGLAFGLAAGALIAGAAAASSPYYYGYGPAYYGGYYPPYYGPRYYGYPAYYGGYGYRRYYGGGPYAYWGGPYRRAYWRPYW